MGKDLFCAKKLSDLFSVFKAVCAENVEQAL